MCIVSAANRLYDQSAETRDRAAEQLLQLGLVTWYGKLGGLCMHQLVRLVVSQHVFSNPSPYAD